MAAGYLLDENVDVAYRDQLVLQSAWTIRIVGEVDAPPKGTDDPAILVWCESRDFVLVTNNRRTMPHHLADHLKVGRHVPGIVMLDASGNIGGNVADLALIADVLAPDELRDQIVYLPIR